MVEEEHDSTTDSEESQYEMEIQSSGTECEEERLHKEQLIKKQRLGMRGAFQDEPIRIPHTQHCRAGKPGGIRKVTRRTTAAATVSSIC